MTVALENAQTSSAYWRGRCAKAESANRDLLEALEAINAQVDDTGRHGDPPDYYAEVPWEFIDKARAAIAKAKG